MARKRWSFWMSPIEHRSFRWIDDVYRCRLTTAGRALLWAMVVSGVMLLGGLVPPLVLCFCFCFSALMMAGLMGLGFRPRVRLHRHLSAFPSHGDVFRYRVTVENTGRVPLRHLVVEERSLPAELRPSGEPPVIAELGPGESADVTLALRCTARGAYRLPAVQAASTFPTGVFKTATPQALADRVLVYPKFTRMEHFDVPHGRNYQPGGISIASQLGDSTEFLGTRDFREGDRVRDIHWPSTARTGRLIVREYQQEYFVRLAMVLDIEALKAAAERRMERALSLAAGIADALARQEYIVDVFCAGDSIYHFQAGRALAHLDNILEILASVEAGDRLDLQALGSALVPQAEKLSAVVFVVTNWDKGREHLVNELKQHGTAVRVVCMDPKADLSGLAAEDVVRLP